MADNTKIEWTDATINFWIGCTKVSAACDYCYAEALSKRMGWAEWGNGAPRYRTKSAPALARKLERKAVRENRRLRVFSNSLSDFFDNEVPDDWRADAWRVIEDTPHLDWLLLTKRHALLKKYLPTTPLPNVRIGVTVENEEMARLRLPALAMLGLRGWKTFVSYEPALGPVNWKPWLDPEGMVAGCIHWIICGGESGPNARPMHPDWARVLRDQCGAAGVAFHFKQWGQWVTEDQSPEDIILPGEARLPWTAWSPQHEEHIGDETAVYSVGKKAAGRLLDGVEHNGYPEAV